MFSIKYYKPNIDQSLEYLELNPIGDLHIGHVAFNIDILKEKLYEIKQKQSISRILLMGDIIECATKSSVGAGVFETDMSIDDQIDYARDLFYPYRDIIDGYVTGNHEGRIYKDTSIDVAKMLADKLSIPYMKYQGIVTYALNKKAYNVNLWHGDGGGSSTGGALQKCMDMSKKTLADIYLMGHTHKLAKTSRKFRIPDSRNQYVAEIKQHFVLTGSALEYDDNYPEMKNLEIVDVGFPQLKLNGKNKKEVTVSL